MSLPGRLVDVDGHQVFVHRSGPRGRLPVVLVHGYLVGHWEWRLVAKPLADAGMDVIAFDFPGCGESDRPPRQVYGYSAAAFSRTLLGVMDHLGVARAQLVGHSMGAAVSLFTAAHHPDRVAKLVLVDPLVYRYSVPVEGRLILTPLIGARLFRTFYNKRAIRKYMAKTIFRDPSIANDDLVDYLYERVCRPGGMEAAHAAAEFGADPIVIEKLVGTVRTPSMVVWGKDDRLFPAAWATRLAGDLGGADVRIIDRCGHSPPEEQPDKFLDAIVPFLQARKSTERSAQRTLAQ